MRLTDISLDWLLPGGILLLGMAVAVAVLARGRKAQAKVTTSDDSWERNEERRRRKEAVYGTASYVLLFCCAAVAAALSFHGLVGFGRQNLNLSDGWEYLVPFGLDGAAMFCSVLAVREASHGDAALGSRLLVWTFAGAAAWFNWVHAPRGIGHAGAPQFFAGIRTEADAAWFPGTKWDWFYGPGYWWFGYDYDWYPGWHLWGCRAPIPWTGAPDHGWGPDPWLPFPPQHLVVDGLSW